MDILKKNPDIFFQMDCVNELIPGSKENPCVYSWRYDSIMSYFAGRGFFLCRTEASQTLNWSI